MRSEVFLAQHDTANMTRKVRVDEEAGYHGS